MGQVKSTTTNQNFENDDQFWRYVEKQLELYVGDIILCFFLPPIAFIMQVFCYSSIWAHYRTVYEDIFTLPPHNLYLVNINWLVVDGLFEIFQAGVRLIFTIVGIVET